jgi:hypothetical protein
VVADRSGVEGLKDEVAVAAVEPSEEKHQPVANLLFVQQQSQTLFQSGIHLESAPPAWNPGVDVPIMLRRPH